MSTIRVTVLSPLLGSAPRARVLSGFQYLTVPLHLVADNLREAVQTVGERAEHLSRPTGKIRTAAKPRRRKCLVVPGFRMEPPWGIEPQTYALRVRRSGRLS